jgi:hypothetical protein
MAAPAILLDAPLAGFVRGGVSTLLSSCRLGRIPTMARGLGCRVADDRRGVDVFLAATPGAALLDDVRHSGMLAVVFSQPSTHRTVQLKGTDAHVVPVEAGDAADIARYIDAFVAEVESIGYAGAIIRTLLACPMDDVVALRFTIAAAFSQTPGPGAGAPLAARP